MKSLTPTLRNVAISSVLVAAVFSVAGRATSTRPTGPDCRLIATGTASPRSPSAILPAPDRLDALRSFLAKNATDRFPYVPSTVDDRHWYVCNHFATQFFLRGSCFADVNGYAEIESATPIRFTRERLPETERLPLFYVHLFNPGRAFSHAIDALYVGSDPRGYDGDFGNYVFLEPQTDELVHPGEYVKRYYPDLSTPTQVSIVLPRRMGRTADGGVQFLTDTLYTFECPAVKAP